MIGSPVAEFLHATHRDISAWGIASVCASGAARTAPTLCARGETAAARSDLESVRSTAAAPPVPAHSSPLASRTGLLLITYSCLPDVRRTPGWQFLYSSICEIYVAAGLVALSMLSQSLGDGPHDLERLMCAEPPR